MEVMTVAGVEETKGPRMGGSDVHSGGYCGTVGRK